MGTVPTQYSNLVMDITKNVEQLRDDRKQAKKAADAARAAALRQEADAIEERANAR